LYSGKDVEHAELVAISANERLIEDFARRLVTEKEPEVRQYIEEQPPTRDSSSSKVA